MWREHVREYVERACERVRGEGMWSDAERAQERAPETHTPRSFEIAGGFRHREKAAGAGAGGTDDLECAYDLECA